MESSGRNSNPNKCLGKHPKRGRVGCNSPTGDFNKSDHESSLTKALFCLGFWSSCLTAAPISIGRHAGFMDSSLKFSFLVPGAVVFECGTLTVKILSLICFTQSRAAVHGTAARDLSDHLKEVDTMKYRIITMAAFLAVLGLALAAFAATAQASKQAGLLPALAASPLTQQAGFAPAVDTATGRMHPCRNWNKSRLTTAQLQKALRDNPKCLQVWDKLTNGGSRSRPQDYIVSGRRSDIKPGDRIINSGVSDGGTAGFYGWTVTPGATFVKITNVATAVSATAKEDCLNPAAPAPRSLVDRLPPMPVLIAWSVSTSQSSAKVVVDCGNGTKITVDANAFAEALAKARTRGGAVVITGTNTKTGITVSIKCGKPKVAKPKQKIGTLVLEKRTDVPTGDRFTLCAQLVNKGPARCWTLNSDQSVTAAQYKVGTVLYVMEDRVPQGWIVPFRRTVTIKPGINRVVILNRKKVTPPVKTYTATISKRVLDTAGNLTSEFANRRMPVNFTVRDRAAWTMQIPMNSTTYGVSIDGVNVTGFEAGMVITACLDTATDTALNLRVVGPTCITRTAGQEELRFDFVDQKNPPPVTPPPPGPPVIPPPPPNPCDVSPRPKQCDPPPPAPPNTATQPVPGPNPPNSGSTASGTTGNSPTRPDGGTPGGGQATCPRGMSPTPDGKGCQ